MVHGLETMKRLNDEAHQRTERLADLPQQPLDQCAMEGTGPPSPPRSDAQLDAAIQALEHAHQREVGMQSQDAEASFTYRQGICVGISRCLAELATIKANQVNKPADPKDGSNHGV